MRHGVHEILFAQVLAKIVDARSRFVYNREMFRFQAPYQNVDFGSVFGEIRGGLQAGKYVGRMPVAQPQDPFDNVVIGNGNKVHACPFCRCVNVFRLDVRLPRPDPLQKPFGRTLGKTRMNVTIGLCHGEPPMDEERAPSRASLRLARGLVASIKIGGDCYAGVRIGLENDVEESKEWENLLMINKKIGRSPLEIYKKIWAPSLRRRRPSFYARPFGLGTACH